MKMFGRQWLTRMIRKCGSRRAFLEQGLGFAMGLLLGAKVLCAQEYRYNPEHRRPVDATIRDLQTSAARNTYSSKERERYDKAMTRLSQFAQRLHDGFFDEGKLDQSINDVVNVLNKNPLDGRSRTLLNRDVLELRRLRANYRLGYRYPYRFQ